MQGNLGRSFELNQPVAKQIQMLNLTSHIARGRNSNHTRRNREVWLHA